MDRSPSYPSLEALQRLLPSRGRTCAKCGRPVDEEPPNVHVHGMWFHNGCAVYRPRREQAA